MATEASAPSESWEQFALWLSEVQELSIDSNSYPLAQNSLLAGDELGNAAVPGPAAVIRTLLDAAVDDLASAYALLAAVGRLSPVAIPTLVRGTIELAGLGMWVLTGKERSGRQERALRVAYDSYSNAIKFHTHRSASKALSADQRAMAKQWTIENQDAAAALVDVAVKAGLKKTRVTVSLNRTEALKEVDTARETQFFSNWQLCSGFAHGLAWAPALFHTKVGTHTMEGGGTITLSVMGEEGALAMLQWGQHAIEELRGTFGAGRSFITDSADATLVSRPVKKMEADAAASGLRIQYQGLTPAARRPVSSAAFSVPSSRSEPGG